METVGVKSYIKRETKKDYINYNRKMLYLYIEEYYDSDNSVHVSRYIVKPMGFELTSGMNLNGMFFCGDNMGERIMGTLTKMPDGGYFYETQTSNGKYSSIQIYVKENESGFYWNYKGEVFA